MIEPDPAQHGAGNHLFGQTDRALAVRLALLIALLGAYRVVTASYGLWFDEFATLIFSDQPLGRLWSGWMVHETNPPLFYTLMKGWQALGFHSILALRLLPVLSGTAGLALLARTAWIGWGRSAAVSAVMIAGVSPLHIYASQMLRGYMLASDGVLLSFAGLLLLLRADPASGMAADRRGTRIALALYVAGSTVAIYCHTTLLLWPPFAMAAFAATARGRLLAARGLLLRQLALANLAVLALAGWWLGITLAQIGSGAENVSWIRAHTLPKYLDLFARSTLLVNQEYLVERSVVIVVGSAVIASIVAARREPATRLAALVFGIGGLGFWAVSKVHPIATAMSLFWMLPFAALLLAGGLASIRQPERERQARLALVGLLAANLVMHGSQLSFQDFAAALRTAHRDPGTGLLVEGATMGAVSVKACEVAFPGRPCPVPIVTVQMARPENNWATALGTIRPLAPADVPAVLAACCRAVYTVRTFDMDPLLDFQIRSVKTRHGWNNPFFEGPVPAASFRPEKFRRTEPYWIDPEDG